MSAGTVYLLHFIDPATGAHARYRHAGHYLGWARDVRRRLAEHEAGRGARLLAVVQAAGLGWELARLWPGGRVRERQIKRQGGHARHCPLCGVIPRCLPANRDGTLSRSLTTDTQKHAAGVMTAAQQAEHTALRRGAARGRVSGPVHLPAAPADDPWYLPLPPASAVALAAPIGATA
jgi:ribosomal protein L34E